DTVKAALTAQYAITFDYTAAQYNGGDPKNNKNHLTDDLEFDTADFSWMLMHGAAFRTGSLQRDDDLGVIDLANVTKLGQKDGEWAVFASCKLFGTVNLAPANKGIKEFIDSFPSFFSNGLHLVLGGFTVLHSNPYLILDRYKKFANQ